MSKTEISKNPAAKASASPPIIRARDLRKVYGTGEVAVEAVAGVTFDVTEGEFVSIMGASGSGKSTLLHVLGCLHQPTGGVYELEGTRVEGLSDRDLSRLRNTKIGVVFQLYNLLPNEDVVSNVALPLVYAHVPRGERERRAVDILRRLGLGHRLGHRPTELSGGQAQRAAIARALVNNPAIILADEPTGNLDSEATEEIMAVFQRLNRAGRTVVQVTHDRANAEYSSRVIHLRDGRIDAIETIDRPRGAREVEIDLDGVDAARGPHVDAS